MGAKIRVMIVDDSAVVRQTLKEILESEPGISVSAVVADPLFALKRMESEKPDVIVTDLEMPRMDGLTFLRTVMEKEAMPFVVCSSKAEDGSDNALRALEYGAVEIIQKPKLGTKQFLEESSVRIVDAVKAAHLSRGRLGRGRLRPARAAQSQVVPKLTADVMLPKPDRVMVETTEKVVVVGASTGGTEALKDFLESFPEDAPGIVIV
ncbi:MAG: response regulator, partial [Spirochaetaceae bacterium]|nr:response regulator [Spirochaetaceae bacterium]